jgi:hypothetical protein|tara:strand:+ start:66 stop:248 length:183 start_codon:yes stop_codon:yes gene_type:complete
MEASNWKDYNKVVLYERARKKFEMLNLEHDNFSLELEAKPNDKFTTAIFTMKIVMLHEEY